MLSYELPIIIRWVHLRVLAKFAAGLSVLGYALWQLVAIAVVVGLAGIVKGLLGLGIMLAVPLMASFLPVPTAMAILFVPLFSSNVVQASHGAPLAPILKRFGPMILGLIAGVNVTAPFMIAFDENQLRLYMGIALVSLVLLDWSHLVPAVPPRMERYLSPATGAMAGLVGGIVPMFGPIIALYFSALRLDKEVFIRAISIVYLCGLIPLNGWLVAHGTLGLTEIKLSVLSVIPIFAGMVIGTRIRKRLNQNLFNNLIKYLFLFNGLQLIILGSR